MCLTRLRLISVLKQPINYPVRLFFHSEEKKASLVKINNIMLVQAADVKVEVVLWFGLSLLGSPSRSPLEPCGDAIRFISFCLGL